MRKSFLASFAVLCLIATGAMAQGLYSNPGFDDGDPVVIDATVDGVVDGSTIPGWRMVATSGRGTFSVVAEASAPSAPNVFQVTPTAKSGFWVDRWGTPVAIDTTKLYKHSAWVRQLGSAGSKLTLRASAFNGEGGYIEINKWDITPTFPTANTWYHLEKLCAYPAEAATALEMIYLGDNDIDYQVDDIVLEEYPITSELFLNGGFEGFTDGIMYWSTTLGATVAHGMTGTITTDAANVAEGNNALSIVKTIPEGAGDALFRSRNIPWTEGHTAYLALSVKNDPTLGDDSRVALTLHSNTDGSSEANALTDYLAGGEADGSYKRYEFELPVEQVGARFVYIDLRLRDNTNGSGAQEAAFVDFISLGDLTAEGVPVEMSSFEIE